MGIRLQRLGDDVRSGTARTSGHGAVEWTFSQFYPDLFDRARRLGTVRSDYDPTRQFE